MVKEVPITLPKLEAHFQTGDTICPVHVCLSNMSMSVSAFNPGSVPWSVLASKVMGLILLPLSQPSQITACFFSPSLFSPASSPSPLLASQTLSLPSFPPFFRSMMVSLSNQTAGQLSAWWLYGRGALSLSPSISLLHFSLPPPLSPSLPPRLPFSPLPSFSPSPSERDYRIRGNVFSWKICCNFQNGCFA